MYPAAFLAFLDLVGVDPQKDGEVHHNVEIEPGVHNYAGWFHFVGTLETAGDFAMIEMSGGFRVWLCRHSAPALDSLKGLPLVQIEFLADRVPWVIREAAPK